MSDFFVHPKALVECEQIGMGTRIWAFAHIMQGAIIGERCNIGDHAFIEGGVRLGNNVTVKNGVAIWDCVTAEDDVFIGPNAVFTNDVNPRAFVKKTRDQLLATVLRRGATVGANATIVCGITIGVYAFVGAGTVVVRDVADYALVVGNPARTVGWMCQCGARLQFQDHSRAHCQPCGLEYRQDDRDCVSLAETTS